MGNKKSVCILYKNRGLKILTGKKYIHRLMYKNSFLRKYLRRISVIKSYLKNPYVGTANYGDREIIITLLKCILSRASILYRCYCLCVNLQILPNSKCFICILLTHFRIYFRLTLIHFGVLFKNFSV